MEWCQYVGLMLCQGRCLGESVLSVLVLALGLGNWFTGRSGFDLIWSLALVFKW
jgi:hypothetical protein